MSGENLSVAEKLELAATKLEQPGGWTQREYARDQRGSAVLVSDPAAVCFCSWGALKAVGDHEEAADYLRTFLGTSITTWNDAPKRTQAEAVAKLREAAALAKAGAA